MKVHIIDEDKQYPEDLHGDEIKSWLRAVLKEFKQTLKRIIPDLTIIFVTKDKIRDLNKRYRGIDEPTDVLSFQSEEDGYLGDIVLSKEMVAHFAKEFSVSFNEELRRDIVHGLMHLLGYNHTFELRNGGEEEMFVIQENILKKFV